MTDTPAAAAGVVTFEHLGRVMRAIGLDPTDEELKNMITEVDGSGKGAVDFAEFMRMMSRNGTSTTAEIKETFGLINESGSGKISAAEIKAIMVKLGEKIDDAEVRLPPAGRHTTFSPSALTCAPRPSSGRWPK